jgi:hypothetical protein
MFIPHYRTVLALVLYGAMALMATACDGDDAAPPGGEEARSGVDAPADVTAPTEQRTEGEVVGQVDGSTDVAAVATPDAPSPPDPDPDPEIAVPGPPDLQTATFALG